MALLYSNLDKLVSAPHSVGSRCCENGIAKRQHEFKGLTRGLHLLNAERCNRPPEDRNWNPEAIAHGESPFNGDEEDCQGDFVNVNEFCRCEGQQQAVLVDHEEKGR